MLRKSFALWVAPLALAAGCASQDAGTREVVRVNAVATDLTILPVRDVFGAPIHMVGVRGFYGNGCTLHAGQPWWLVLNDPTDGIEVALGDSSDSCPLVLTSFVGQRRETSYFLPLVPYLGLTPSFADEPAAVVFNTPHKPLAFYVNAKLNGLPTTVYDRAFSIRALYSDSAKVLKQSAPPAVYGTISVSAEGAKVAPPDYALSFEGLRLVVDQQWNVQGSSAGYVTLVGGSQPGEEWRLYNAWRPASPLITFAVVDWLYTQALPSAIGTIEEAGDIPLLWSRLVAPGETLPVTRTLVTRHTGDAGVYSYEMFRITFPGPSSTTP